MPINVINYNTAGSLVICVSKKKKANKVKSIQNIESWTNAFHNYMNNYLSVNYQRYNTRVTSSFDIYYYDQQFRFRIANNLIRSWSSIICLYMAFYGTLL